MLRLDINLLVVLVVSAILVLGYFGFVTVKIPVKCVYFYTKPTPSPCHVCVNNFAFGHSLPMFQGWKHIYMSQVKNMDT